MLSHMPKRSLTPSRIILCRRLALSRADAETAVGDYCRESEAGFAFADLYTFAREEPPVTEDWKLEDVEIEDKCLRRKRGCQDRMARGEVEYSIRDNTAGETVLRTVYKSYFWDNPGGLPSSDIRELAKGGFD